ncbi:MAG: DUF3575 domain-containing protein [Flavobacteriales bacterium]|jgi:hypothetical protein|nr:DUF3575 domain-containing protein [Flavobacteriales bacterium]
MKHFIFASVLAFLGLGATAQQVTQNIKTNPLGFFAAQYQLAYEYGLNDNLSVQLSAGAIGGSGEAFSLDPNVTNQISTTRSGFIVIPELRYFPGGSACEGFYISLGGRYRTATTVDSDDNERLSRQAAGGSLLLGFQKVGGDGYTVDFFLGPQFKTVDASGDLDVSGLFNNDDNVGVRLGVNIGFGW